MKPTFNRTVRKNTLKYLILLRDNIDQEQRTWENNAERLCTERYKIAKRDEYKRLMKAAETLIAYMEGRMF